jgi:cytochrome c-type biogenesis protein CcmH/NrfG
LENAGKKAEAIDAYRHAVALDPSNSHAQNALKHLAG